mmetsp:Transcript_32116/g.108115  ORF Transcript_32116/g.108115 Transcript_32116/m.108115 type:complete len:244 (+) Transcript_32116:1482-2213(+)
MPLRRRRSSSASTRRRRARTRASSRSSSLALRFWTRASGLWSCRSREATRAESPCASAAVRPCCSWTCKGLNSKARSPKRRRRSSSQLSWSKRGPKRTRRCATCSSSGGATRAWPATSQKTTWRGLSALLKPPSTKFSTIRINSSRPLSRRRRPLRLYSPRLPGAPMPPSSKSLPVDHGPASRKRPRSHSSSLYWASPAAASATWRRASLRAAARTTAWPGASYAWQWTGAGGPSTAARPSIY